MYFLKWYDKLKAIVQEVEDNENIIVISRQKLISIGFLFYVS